MLPMMLKSTALLLAVLSISCLPTWYGTPYETLNCSQYVAKVNQSAPYTASELWAVPKGYKLIAEYSAFHLPESGTEGDVLALHGAHVAVYHDGIWTDSDPVHGGVGRMQPRLYDPWFTGPVRLLRVLR
jgi:hypothetical protein